VSAQKGDGHVIELSDRLSEIESADVPIKSLPGFYGAGERVAKHKHSRAQLLYAREGVVIVAAAGGRWVVPLGHALWIPGGVEHEVEMLVNVNMLSLYVAPGVLTGIPETVRVVAVDSLAHELIVAAVQPGPGDMAPGRSALVMPLLLDVISSLPESPLGLPFPQDRKLASLCRMFVANPDAGLAIETWADKLSMSRRTFTRFFRQETGLSLSQWRQQACLFAALPRLAGGEAVTSVALDLGYDSVSAFITMFKRTLGAPPRAYMNTRDRPATHPSQ
jgi:AraC-like DNA-binding protein/mannose-6-phosphate isomerase-like protein (cupin superfamily)